ncbi:peptidase S8, partial [Streptomyces sp. A1136]
MPLHISRTRRAVAASAGLATAAALAFLPGTASAASADGGPLSTKAAQPTGPELSYIVNVRPGHGNSARVQRAVAQAGGSVLQAYDQIGVLVVHSANADF